MKDLAGRLRTLAAALASTALLSCYGGSTGYPDVGPIAASPIGGTVAGLGSGAGSAVTLLNNGGDATVVSANGPFAFPTALTFPATYAVTVGTQPSDRTCVVMNGNGTALPNVNVTVACTSNTNAPQSGDLVITEVLANPAGAGSDNPKEWFEVVNTGPARDLGGVVVTSGSGLFVVPAGTMIPGGAFFVFGESIDATANGGLPTVNVSYGSALTLANTTVSLSLSVAGTAVDSVSLTSITDGASLALKQSQTDPTANDTQSNWCTSTTAYGTAGNKGTPCAANTDCP